MSANSLLKKADLFFLSSLLKYYQPPHAAVITSADPGDQVLSLLHKLVNSIAVSLVKS